MDSANTSSIKILINETICGILSLPLLQKSNPAVLFLHGFASDKDEINKIYQHMAEQLNKKNIITLRIDFRCWGESEGTMEESTIDKMVEDSIVSLNYLKNLENVDPHNIAIIGFSLGAAIGILATEFITCKALTLISPAANLKNDFTKFIGEQLMSQLKNSTQSIEIILPWKKVRISKNFYLSLGKHDPLATIQAFTGHLHCIAGNRDFTSLNATNIIERSQSRNKKLSIIDDADHIFFLSNGENILLDMAGDVIFNISETLKCKSYGNY